MSLSLITKEELNKKITERFSYSFRVEKSGIFAIVVSARAKSWFQNLTKFISFFRDDNLAIKINGMSFPKLSGERGEFDGEVSWNGNKLKGLGQVNIFVVYFEKGEQNLEFVSKGSPLLEGIKIHEVDKHKISIDPSTYFIEDGDKRPWFNVFTNSVGIISIYAKAIASVSRDDNDLQIRINGIREQNSEPKAHKYWFWCGRVLKGQPKIFDRTLNLKPGLNYIEFWADGAPVFNELNIHIATSDRIPSIDNPEWTGDFYDDSEEMILARAIWGEARGASISARIAVAWSIKNRLGTIGKMRLRRDTYYDIILESDQYSAFWEIPGKDPNLKALRDPLGTTKNSDDHNKWRETYLIAEQVIGGEVIDPIDGANHYFDDSRSHRPPFWATEDKLVKKVENISFYRL